MSLHYITQWGTLVFDKTVNVNQKVSCIFSSDHENCDCQHCILSRIISEKMTEGYSVIEWQPYETHVIEINLN
jgi:hypothetical protein